MKNNWGLRLSRILVGFLCLVITMSLAGGCLPEKPGEKALNLWDSGPTTLDPAISSSLSSHTYVMQIFSGLVCLDNELKPAPDIAEGWEKSSDGKTFIFHLRKGVKFHNGKEVTARDFKYSWERACNPATGSQIAATYLGDIAGASDVLKGKTKEISGVQVIDEYTLKVSIDAPKAYFLSKLTYPTAYVVDKANVESGRGDWYRQPNGTGPFKLKTWLPDKQLILERNERYYGQQAATEQIVFHLLGGVPIAMYELNEIDVSPVWTPYMDMATDKNSPLSKELAVFPELSLYFIGFNAKKPPFDDVNIRRAFSHAINKKRIVELTLKGTMTPAAGILPRGMPGYNPNLRGLDYNVARAMDLIAKSKYGSTANLPPITITDSGYGGNIPEYLGAVIQDWKQNLGVEVSVRQLDPDILAFPHYYKQEADEMFSFGWIADYPDPQNFLDVLFHTGADYNICNYSNPDVDATLDKAAVEQDNTSRLKIYQQVEQKLVEEAVCLPLGFETSYMLIKPYVKEYKLNPHGVPALREVYLNK